MLKHWIMLILITGLILTCGAKVEPYFLGSIKDNLGNELRWVEITVETADSNQVIARGRSFSNGEFIFVRIPEGIYNIKFHLDGYNDFTHEGVKTYRKGPFLYEVMQKDTLFKQTEAPDIIDIYRGKTFSTKEQFEKAYQESNAKEIKPKPNKGAILGFVSFGKYRYEDFSTIVIKPAGSNRDVKLKVECIFSGFYSIIDIPPGLYDVYEIYQHYELGHLDSLIVYDELKFVNVKVEANKVTRIWDAPIIPKTGMLQIDFDFDYLSQGIYYNLRRTEKNHTWKLSGQTDLYGKNTINNLSPGEYSLYFFNELVADKIIIKPNQIAYVKGSLPEEKIYKIYKDK